MSTSPGSAPSDEPGFRDLIRRVREQDPEAEQQLWERYRLPILRWVRWRRSSSWRQNKVVSEDVLISVMDAICQRLRRDPEFLVESPRQLYLLLFQSTQWKYIDHLRRVLGWNYRRVPHGLFSDIEMHEPSHGSTGPPLEVRDLLLAVRDRLPPFERQLLDLRLQELTWPEIHERLGLPTVTPQALSARLRRAVATVLKDLGFTGDLDFLEDVDEL